MKVVETKHSLCHLTKKQSVLFDNTISFYLIVYYLFWTLRSKIFCLTS